MSEDNKVLVAGSKTRNRYETLINNHFAMLKQEKFDTIESEMETAKTAWIDSKGLGESYARFKEIKETMTALRTELEFLEGRFNEAAGTHGLGISQIVETQAYATLGADSVLKELDDKRKFYLDKVWSLKSLAEIIDLVNTIAA